MTVDWPVTVVLGAETTVTVGVGVIDIAEPVTTWQPPMPVVPNVHEAAPATAGV